MPKARLRSLQTASRFVAARWRKPCLGVPNLGKRILPAPSSPAQFSREPTCARRSSNASLLALRRKNARSCRAPRLGRAAAGRHARRRATAGRRAAQRAAAGRLARKRALAGCRAYCCLCLESKAADSTLRLRKGRALRTGRKGRALRTGREGRVHRGAGVGTEISEARLPGSKIALRLVR